MSPVELNLMTELVSDTVGFLEMSTRVGVMEYSESATVWIRFVLLRYWITKYFQARIIPSSGGENFSKILENELAICLGKQKYMLERQKVRTVLLFLAELIL